jgi:hypothetical protein
MKKNYLLLFLCLSLLFSNAQVSYNAPYAVTYDAIHQRYIVSNGQQSLLSVVPGDTLEYFYNNASHCAGLVAVDNRLYVNQLGYLKQYNLDDGTYMGSSSMSNIIFSGVCSVNNDSLYLTSNGYKKIVKRTNTSFAVYKTLTQYPTGITYDQSHNRLIVVTDQSFAQILGISLTTNTVSVLKNTNLGNLNGIAIDEDGNYYFSSVNGANQGIYILDSNLTGSPLKIISFSSGGNPNQIYYNRLTDTLVVPLPASNKVEFYGFPRPKPVDDYRAIILGDSQTICVLQNDLITGNKALKLVSYTLPQYGHADTMDNCIKYTADSVGIENITYTVCTTDTPRFCRKGVLHIFNVAGSGNHAPIATNDTASTVQLMSVSVNVLTNDVDADGDTLCIKSIIASPRFAMDTTGCSSITFSADSFTMGNDTCYYIVCDNDTLPLCDTGMMVVNTGINHSLLPIADFVISFENFTCYNLTTINTSIGDTGKAVWVFKPQFGQPDMTLYGDTGYYLNFNMWGYYGEVCLYVSNQFGSDSVCHSYQYICEGVSEISLPDVRLYPNPVANELNITVDESLVGAQLNIYNINGELLRGSQVQTLKFKLKTDNLPVGLYIAEIKTKEASVRRRWVKM